jgi:hypothetical protein
MHLPCFELKAGYSSLYLKLDEIDSNVWTIGPLPFGVGTEPTDALMPESELLYSWKGMSVRPHRARQKDNVVVSVLSLQAVVECDITDSSYAKLSLNREEFQVEPDAHNARLTNTIYKEMRRNYLQEAKAHPESPLIMLSHVLAEDGIPANEGFYWISLSEGEGTVKRVWRRIEFPTITVFRVPFDYPSTRIRYQGREVQSHPSINVRGSDGGGWGRMWHAGGIAPDKVVYVP